MRKWGRDRYIEIVTCGWRVWGTGAEDLIGDNNKH